MKTQILIIATLLLFVLNPQYALAQEPEKSKAHEFYVYVKLHDLTLTDLAFKSEIKDGLYFRIGATNLMFNSNLNKPDGTSSQKSCLFSGGIQAGLEKRVKFTEKLSAFYGMDLITSVTCNKTKTTYPDKESINKLTRIEPGFSFGSGFVLNLVKNLSVALEVKPSVLMSFATFESTFGSDTISKTRETTFKIDCNSNAFKLALVYRW
jgi:hypothetical protein